jgi:opacity protein-like surface antigen
MRLLCGFILFSTVAFSQPFGFGVKAGVPLTDFLDAASNQQFSFNTTTNRYVIGPMAELRLPFGLGVEINALYRHFGYAGANTVNTTTSVGAWEFPLVGKYRFKGSLVHPYLEAGVAWDKLSGLTQTVSSTVGSLVGTTSNPPELRHNVTTGFVFGGGLEVKLLILRIAPGIRFTRWGDKHFLDPNGLLHSNLNQAEFLVGFKL